MTQNTETQALTDDDLVERLRKRAADDQGFQKNNEAVEVALKAKLAKAVEALESWKHYDESNEVDHVSLMLNYADAIEKTRTTLAELAGGKDECDSLRKGFCP